MAWRFDYRHLGLILFPIGAMLLTLGLLYRAQPGRLAETAWAGLEPQAKLAELIAGHYLYLAAVLAVTTLCIPVTYFALRQIFSRTRGTQRLVVLGIVATAALALIFSLHGDLLQLCLFSSLGNEVGNLPAFRAIGVDLIAGTLGRVEFPARSIGICGLGPDAPLTAAQWLRLHVELGNFLPLLAQCSLVAALCTVLAEPDVPPPSIEADRQVLVDGLNEQLRALNHILYAATALMIVGIITMHLWMRLPGLVLDGTAVNTVAKQALSVLTYYAVGFCAILLSIYLPTALQLQQRAKSLAGPIGQLSARRDPGDWLKQQGFTLDLRSQAGQVLAVIGPLLAGPLPLFLEALLTGGPA
ncbi:MAG: hypothetical protein QNJ67_17120 [Kiloniellales bacterium]|nr:hypothetical protein [Kiloniellales bacterium]